MVTSDVCRVQRVILDGCMRICSHLSIVDFLTLVLRNVYLCRFFSENVIDA